MNAKFFQIALFCGLLGLSSVYAQPSQPVEVEENGTHQENTVTHEVVLGIGKDVVLKKGETTRNVVVVGGNAKVDGTVLENIVVVGGKLMLNGEVHQDTYIVGGPADVGPETKTHGDFVIVGGELTRASQAQVNNTPIEILPSLGPVITSILTWLQKGLLWGRPVVLSLPLVWMVLGAFFVFYCLLAVMFRGPLATGVQTLELHPIASFAAGFLFFVVMAPLMALLIFSGAGLLLLPFILCAIVVVALIGKITVYEYLGSLISSRLRPPAMTSLLALAIGMLICVLLGAVPFVGFLVWAFIPILGVGAVVLASFQILREKAAKAFPPSPRTETSPNSRPVPPEPQVPPLIHPITLADFGPRLGALVLDIVVVGGVLAFVHLTPLFPLAMLAYYVTFMVWRGSTIGDMITGIKCTRANGEAVTLGIAIVRTLSSVLSALPLGLGFFWAAWDVRRQAWHDKVAGTVMVKAV